MDLDRDRLKAYFPIDILDGPLCPVESVKNLCACFDSDFSLSKHVQSVCKNCFMQHWDFRRVRWYFTPDGTLDGLGSFILMMLLYFWSMKK